MATSAHSIPVPAQQPGLRAFIVCDRIPEGCKAYVVPDNRQLPHLRAGEWVVVDPDDRVPTHGDLFMIQWQSGRAGPQVVEAGLMRNLSQQRGEPYWAVGARHRGAHNATALVFGEPGQIIGDFPYRSEQLTERFLGKVVGILEHAFGEPQRLASG
jgi:hypothetical protein